MYRSIDCQQMELHTAVFVFETLTPLNIFLGDEILTELQVINIPLSDGSGSGISVEPDDTVISMPTSGADITDFENITEEIGQLYAYYYSETSVVLGTRSATNGTIQMAVGLSAVANGVYVCIVDNFINATSRIDVDIQAIRSEQPVYLCDCAHSTLI